MSEPIHDVVFIGGGPGGYAGAIRAAQLGLKVACVERRGTLGGTCLNVGCIPSKALLQSSHLYAQATHELGQHGIGVAGVELDLARMMARKDKVVADLTRGIEQLFRKNKVDYLKGSASLATADRVRVAADGGERVLAARHVVLATGSEVMPLPGVAIDERRIVSSTGALCLPAAPKHLVVVGGGYIGLELGSVWARLGAKVTVVEFLDRVLPNMDGEVSKQVQRLLQRQGLTFKLSTKVAGAIARDDGVDLTLEAAAGGAGETLACDIVLVAVGRRPATHGLGLEAIGVARDARGFVPVDARYCTNVAGVHAIGDLLPERPMLAHKAEEEGVAVAELLAGKSAHVNYEAIPGVVYTWPEVAAVGRSEEELKRANRPYRVGKFPFLANSRARANADTDGFVKLLADAGTDRLLGAHIVGPDAGTMIAELALALEFAVSAEDIARTCHAHPTLNEAVKEAALALDGRAINI